MTTAATAGDYAALVNYSINFKSGGGGSTVELYDLRTGRAVAGRGGESLGCDNPSPGYSGLICESNQIDDVVLGGDAVSAVHTRAPISGCGCEQEQIVASDSTGVHTLDSAIDSPVGSSAQLTNLTLVGDLLIWNHNGTTRTAQLQP